MKLVLLFIIITLMSGSCQDKQVKYEPDWASLEQYDPAPEWFKDAKFGIYLHWGVYSVPAFGNEWYPRHMYRPGTAHQRHHIETYGDPTEWPYHYFITGAKDKQGNYVQFAPKLNSDGGNFDPMEWAQLFADAGAKYAGLAAEHHDGFSLWASDVNPWNANDMGPKLDLVGLLTDAIRAQEMKVILSMHHAFHITGFYDHVPQTDNVKEQILYAQLGKEKNEELWLEKHKELIDNYQPDILWQDFNLDKISEPILLKFLAHYYNKASEWNREVVATYKDGLNNECAVLDYERGGPADMTDYYWLTDDAISRSSWSYTEGLTYYSPKQVLHGFFDRISKNGNLLLNISPKADGTIPQEQKEILLVMGDWLKKYGEAVYSTRAWTKYGEGPTLMGSGQKHIGGGEFEAPSEGTAEDIRFTRSIDNKVLYAIVLGWPGDRKTLSINSLSPKEVNIKYLKSVELLGPEKNRSISLVYKQDESGMHITMPDRQFNELAYVIKFRFSREIST